MMISPETKQIIEKVVIYLLSFWISIASLVVLVIKVARNGLSIFTVKKRTPPPILTDPRWGTHQYISLKRQNIKLHYVEKGDRKNPMLLCLHGFPQCWFSWRHQLEEFSSRFWVVAIDMRGYGDSDKPGSVSDYKTNLIVEDIKEFVEESGQSKVTLMAHDWGAVIAWILVETCPNLFQRHISINGPHRGAFREVLHSSLNQLKKSWYIYFFQCPFLPELFLSLSDFEALEKAFRGSKNLVEAFPDGVMEAYKYYAAQKGGLRCPINYYRASVNSPSPLAPSSEEKKISVPTLIVWGTEDVALSKDIPKRMTKLCSDIQLKMVEGVGHFSHEEEPAHVNKLVWDYIQLTN